MLNHNSGGPAFFPPHHWLWPIASSWRQTCHLVFKSFSQCLHLLYALLQNRQPLHSSCPGRCATYLWYVVASLLTNSVKPGEAKQRLSSGQDAACAQTVSRFKNQITATLAIAIALALALAAENQNKKTRKEFWRNSGKLHIAVRGNLVRWFSVFFCWRTDLYWSALESMTRTSSGGSSWDQEEPGGETQK